MPRDPASLAAVLDGWQGYETSLEHAIEPLTPEQLGWRPAPELRSVGELALLLGMLGAPAFELGDLFGHIVLPPLADGAG